MRPRYFVNAVMPFQPLSTNHVEMDADGKVYAVRRSGHRLLCENLNAKILNNFVDTGTWLEVKTRPRLKAWLP